MLRLALPCLALSCPDPSWFGPSCQVGVTKFDGFEVEVVDPVADYLACLKEVFDFGMLKAFVSRSDFSMIFDAMNAVTGELQVDRYQQEQFWGRAGKE